jgi:hypothetical protein
VPLFPDPETTTTIRLIARHSSFTFPAMISSMKEASTRAQ